MSTPEKPPHRMKGCPCLVGIPLKQGDFSDPLHCFLWGGVISAVKSDSSNTQAAIWLWVKNGYPKWNPGKWNQRLKHAVPWWCYFDSYPYHFQGRHLHDRRLALQQMFQDPLEGRAAFGHHLGYKPGKEKRAPIGGLVEKSMGFPGKWFRNPT